MNARAVKLDFDRGCSSALWLVRCIAAGPCSGHRRRRIDDYRSYLPPVGCEVAWLGDDSKTTLWLSPPRMQQRILRRLRSASLPETDSQSKPFEVSTQRKQGLAC